MRRQLLQLVRLVDDLLDISRITLGKVNLRKERVTLAECLRTAVEEAQPCLDLAQHELTISMPPDQVYLDADPVRLAQVFSNLLNNAIKYTELPGAIELTAVREATEVRVSVRDNGGGIAADLLPRVFDIFMQGAEPRRNAQSGLGLGLTLVRALVQMHGGTVEARSSGLGLGSEFVVRLPLASGPPPAIAETGAGTTNAVRSADPGRG